MKVRKSIFLLFLFLFYLPVLAQVEEAWVGRYSGLSNYWDESSALAVDDSGNVYVTGKSWDSVTHYDYATIKYSPNGNTMWVRRYNGTENGDEKAIALAVDKNENLYVTGWSRDVGFYSNYTTIKYAPNGDTLWIRDYNGPIDNYDYATSLTIDLNGNVYVTGWSLDTGTSKYFVTWDYATIKYSPNGDTLWVRRYNGPANGSDLPGSIFSPMHVLAMDGDGNVYVTGSSDSVFNYEDYATIKYSPTGDTLWVRRYNGPQNSRDEPSALTVDQNGNVCVTGKSSNIGTLNDFATIKYSSNGDTLWVRRYNGSADSNDVANAIGVDDSGNVYVTGVSRGTGAFSDDIATIKYSPNGDELWVRRFDGGNGWDGGKDLVLDKKGNVYVTGYSRSLTNEDFVTIKYAPNGDILWQMRYNGPVDSNDIANAIAIDDSGNVYVTGRSIGSHTYQDHDYATIKYVQYTCLAKPADANGDGQILLSDITTIINFLFKGDVAPNPVCRGDANKDGNVLLSDIVYLINFLFKSGLAPSKNKECCL